MKDSSIGNAIYKTDWYSCLCRQYYRGLDDPHYPLGHLFPSLFHHLFPDRNFVGDDRNHGSYHYASCILRQRRRAKYGSLCRRSNNPRGCDLR